MIANLYHWLQDLRRKIVVKSYTATILLAQIIGHHHSLIKIIPYPIFYQDAEGHFVRINALFAKYLGGNIESILGKTMYEVAPQSLASKNSQADQFLLLAQGKKIYETTIHSLRRDNHVTFNKSALLDSQGSVIGSVGIIFEQIDNIGKNTNKEDMLRCSEERFRRFFDSAPTGMVMCYLDGRFMQVNTAYCQLTGYTKGELIGIPFNAIGFADDPLREHSLLPSLLAGDIPYFQLEKRYRHKEGYAVWVSLTVTTVKDDRDIPQYLIVQVFDISKNKELESALRDAKDRAEAADRAKSEFLAAMSHEIRTPMNGVLGMANLLIRTPLDVRQHHYVDTIHSSGQTLLRIIDDILDFSKIQAGKLELEDLPFNLKTVIENLASLFREQASTKGILFSFKLPENAPIALVGDAGRVSQILFNLVGNAMKFTKQGSITVIITPYEITPEEILYCFTVRDTGIGIPEEYQQKLFDAFSQADRSITRRFGGSGLGLVICKQLVTLMGGEMGFFSLEGQGSTFWFECPFKTFQGDKQAWLEAVDQRDNEIEEEAIRFRANILLAEDNPVNQDVVIATLEMYGCQTAVAENGREVVDLFIKNIHHFHLILMDCEMPERDGYSASEQIRAHEAEQGLSRIPIVALTANVLASAEARCMQSGMDGFLKKPFSHRELLKILKQYLSPSLQDRDISQPFSHGDRENHSFLEATQEAHGKSSEISSNPEEIASRLTPQEIPLDRTVLERILQLEKKGSHGLLQKMVEHYQKSSSTLFWEIQRGLDENNSERIRIAAHSLKSASATLGATVLASQCKEIEQASAHPEKIRSTVDQMKQTLREAQNALVHFANLN